MDATSVNTIVTIIGIVAGVAGLIFGGKYLLKKSVKGDDNRKKVGRDDNSINIGDNARIDHSFNKESSFLKKD